MRKVVDANYLNDPGLERYLSDRPGNMVVLTEYAGMEAYKGNPVKNICASMRILSRFPRQVIVLKSSAQNIKENQAPDTMDTGALVDQENTDSFPTFCIAIERAKSGDVKAIKATNDVGNGPFKKHRDCSSG